MKCNSAYAACLHKELEIPGKGRPSEAVSEAPELNVVGLMPDSDLMLFIKRVPVSCSSVIWEILGHMHLVKVGS